MITFLNNNKVEYSHDLRIGKDFRKKTTGTKHKEKTGEFSDFSSSKDTTKREQMETTEWETMFEIHATNIVFKIHEGLLAVGK